MIRSEFLEEKLEKKKLEILALVRRFGTEEDAHDLITDLAIAGAELVELEK